MQVSQVSCARPGGVNEDYACTGPDWGVVLDGATPVAGPGTGSAGHAITGAVPLLDSAGPAVLVAPLREAERNNHCAGDKHHDDATAVHLRLWGTS